jgi:8-oxo-dGTP pyrophosphatase MutT (NUDIX family)
MGGAWVFPGGALDDVDASDLAAAAVSGPASDAAPHDELAWRAAALRELVEETGIWLTVSGATTALPRTAVDAEVYQTLLDAHTRLDGAGLGYFANWVTPSVLPIRFDTRFFAGCVDDMSVEPEPDGVELDRAAWVEPAVALRRATAGEWAVPFPTRKNLQFLALFPTVADLMAYAASVEVTSVEPRLRADGDDVTIVLPDEPGFEDLPIVPQGAAELLAKFRRAGAGTHPEVGSP